MHDRQLELAVFLKGTPWQNWTKNPLPADASARSYQRLTHGTGSVILMDAPSNTGEDVRPFVEIARTLIQYGLAAPRILKVATDLGFLLLEDLGKTDFASTLNHQPNSDTLLYRAATDVLLHLRQQVPPKLTKMTPEVGGDMVRIVGKYYVQSSAVADDLAEAVETALANHCSTPNVLALRDYHAENLIWRPDQINHLRVGLLDFQDAFIAPDGYDLASLLRDARRDVSPRCTDQMITHFAAATNQTKEIVETAVATLSVQRNLRILGVFGRLIQTHSKRRYAAMLPRVWEHIMRDAEHPALGKLQAIIQKGIPDPMQNSIKAWTT